MPRGRWTDPRGNAAVIYSFSGEREKTAEKYNLRTGLTEHGNAGVQLIKAHTVKQEYLGFYIA